MIKVSNNLKADVIVDLQFGSTGKGLISGYLSESEYYDTVVAANMPNAGHTYIDSQRRKFIHKALPSGVYVSRNIMIGPGAVFDPARLAQEIAAIKECGILGNKRIVIHDAAGVLLPEHKETEQKTLSRISSTMQGSAACLTDKIMRKESAIVKFNRVILEEHGLWEYVVPQHEWLGILHNAQHILVEGSQGYSLGISAGFYPYCTSRECTAARVMADCGIPAGWLREVIGVARCHPIRVGNTSDGFSGNCYFDQEEISWEKLGVDPEKTTVTGRIRRVFTFSHQQILESMIANSVSKVFLNFANYDTDYAKECIGIINEIAEQFETGGVWMVGTGPAQKDVMSLMTFNHMYV